jgi:hypothetical protein
LLAIYRSLKPADFNDSSTTPAPTSSTCQQLFLVFVKQLAENVKFLISPQATGHQMQSPNAGDFVV